MPIHNLILSGYEICYTLLLVIRYSLIDLLGLSLYNLYTTKNKEECVLDRRIYIGFSLSGSLLRVNYKLVLLYIGVGGDYLLNRNFYEFRSLLL